MLIKFSFQLEEEGEMHGSYRIHMIFNVSSSLMSRNTSSRFVENLNLIKIPRLI